MRRSAPSPMTGLRFPALTYPHRPSAAPIHGVGDASQRYLTRSFFNVPADAAKPPRLDANPNRSL
ncbi:hypothetical protein BD626DRAFT_510913 [Schizophyllum amplum]|uniref:Uncharacterized protein n=1 Tax=Schizophyllum amplum TaxID=97359 RepID=A0A550C1G6_9AGAR|nr:hypothetical protein BD626DRAFT_510913 [Auriculariopsis ampla]